MVRYYRTTDRLLILMCVVCSVMGSLLLLGEVSSELVSMRKVMVQVLASLLGLAAAFAVSLFDYKDLAGSYKIHVPLTYLLVIATFFLGVQRGGNKAWLYLFSGAVSLQPSEFLKISFILTLAYHLSKVKDDINSPLQVVLLCAHGAVPILVIHFLQRDDGTALIFASIFVTMVFIAGIGTRYIAAAVGAVAVAAPLTWFFVLDQDQKMRLVSVYNPGLDPLVYDWQQNYSRIAIGSGKIWGKGLFSGTHVPVPEIQNDFIFAFAGESLGFIGCAAILLLLALVCARLLSDSAHAPDDIGRFICAGIFAMVFFQIFINIGACLSILPVIGVTLPFFSSGGSSVLSLYIGIGLVLSVYRNSEKALFSD